MQNVVHFNGGKDEGGVKHIGTMKFAISKTGEVLTQEQEAARQLKKEQVERAAKERL